MTQPFAPQEQPNYSVQRQPPPLPPKRWNKFKTAGVIVGVLAVLGIGNAIGGGSKPTTAPSESVTTATNEPVSKTTSPAPKKTATAKAKETKPPTKAERRTMERLTEPHQRVSRRTYAKILRDPDEWTGKKIIIYGEVTQFDSATGRDTFRADTAYRNTTSYGFFNGTNTILTGSKKKLDDLVENDVFRAAVTVLGSTDYDTQIGGNTTVAVLQVDSVKVIGEN